MGKIKQGILGGFTGKVGGVVGSSWKGIATVKARPVSVSNPRTAKQIGQRSKMSNTVAFAKVILADVIKPLWDRFSGQKSGYNAFVQRNIKLFENAMPSPAEDLVISDGKMAATELQLGSSSVGQDEIIVNWMDDSGEGFKLATDLAYVVIVNETQKVIGVSAGKATREDETLTVTMPTNLAGLDKLHKYLAFLRADGTIVGKTAYQMTNLSA